MSTIRVEKNKQNPYVMLNKAALDDENLTFKAKGIFSYLMSKPDNWRCQVEDLIKHAKDGRDSIKAGLRELREHGYMIKRPIKNEKGIITEWEEILFETPQEEAKIVFKEQNNKSTNGKSVNGVKIKKSTNGKSTTGLTTNGEPVPILSNDILSTNSLSTELSSSSIEDINIKDYFEANICVLKKTTEPKLLEIVTKYDRAFIIAIIDYAAEVGAKSYSWFDKTIKANIEKNIITAENFIKSVEEFRSIKNSKKVKGNTKKNNKSNFTNYEQRGYDFKELERKILDSQDEKLKNIKDAM